jgi:hypothetical protein
VTNAAMDCRRACAIAHTKNAGDMYNRTPLTAAGSPSPPGNCSELPSIGYSLSS